MIKLDKTFLKFVALCAIGLTLNVLGSLFTRNFELPIYLDTFGTIFIAALGGYVPGIIVGFFTNFIGSFFNDTEMHYGIVSVSIAWLTASLARKGYYENFPKAMTTIPVTILVTSFLGAFFGELVSPANSFNSLDSINKFFINFLETFFKNFYYELPDKSLTIIMSFFALECIPPKLKEDFKSLGKMQATVTDEVHEAINAKNRFTSSLRTKMIFNLMSITLGVAVFISYYSYTTYRDAIIEEHKRIANGIVTMVAEEIDPKRVDEFLELGHHAQGYNEVEKKLYKIRNSNYNVKYIYVYKIMEDGCHVVFDLDTGEVEGTEPGEIEEFDEEFYSVLDDLLAGRHIPPKTSNGQFGNLLTIYKPVYDSVGNCVCYAGLDFSMDEINDYGRRFIARVIAIFSGAVVFIFVLGLWFIENNIILPVNTMAYCAKNFAYDSEAARGKNVKLIKSLDIRTHDEIENLYSAFLKTTADSMNYFENFKKAKVQAEVLNELAHKDALTGLQNKTSYTEKTAKLDEEIAAARAEFCIIMIDVNFLKRVNDTYGHEYGNTYLINAGKLACSVFGEENVYRIGGDEFVVVLTNEQLATVDDNVAKFRGIINKFKANNTLEAWEKVSAAVGVSYYEAGVDKTAEEVFKRADEDMYKNKLAMKAQRRD